MTTYDRRRLVDVLVYHQRATSQHCACGWGKLGASHAEHVADVYEQTVRLEGQEEGDDPARVRSEWGSGREGTDDGGQDGG